MKNDNCVINCVSNNKSIRALEFINYILGGYGITTGGAVVANGEIPKLIIDADSAFTGMDAETLIEKMSSKYFEDTEVINSMEDEISLDDMKHYVKRRIPWAFVRTKDICGIGTNLCIKSLENTSGVIITSAEDLYIMIGNRGEVYDIKREKFEASYIETNEKLDVFESMLNFIPSVLNVDSGNYESIDELAYMCYPRKGNGIYAKELQKRTKVFGINNNAEYFIGEKGDYLAARVDDVRDVYIIKRDIFQDTYEACEK
ncbi:MAG: hypothetical protein SOV90_02385 [Lachnospiraceae bacterium]|nr:hypothetical protein [Lachnospiraceae bacterium]